MDIIKEFFSDKLMRILVVTRKGDLLIQETAFVNLRYGLNSVGGDLTQWWGQSYATPWRRNKGCFSFT